MEPSHKRARKAEPKARPKAATVNSQPSAQTVRDLQPSDTLAPLQFFPSAPNGTHPRTCALREHNKRARLQDERRLRERVNAIGASCTATPPPENSASTRLRALAERVKARVLEEI